MKAIVQEIVGGPEVLQVAERPVPEPGDGEILVRVRAAGINPVDVGVRSGAIKLLGDPPFVLGWDISGTVERVGPGVSGTKAGDAVFGMPRFPGQAAAYAEYAAVPAGEMAAKPARIGHAEAAGLPLAGLTAWQGLVRIGGLKEGQRVLIHAGAGGVGHLAVQIAKALGAHVVATASAGKLDFVHSIGADEVIDYQKEDFARSVGDIDLVLEPIGEDHALRSLKTLRDGGVLVALRAIPDELKAQAELRGIRIERILVKPDRAGLIELAALVEKDRLKVHVARTFALDQAAEAHRFLGTHPIGKVVLTA